MFTRTGGAPARRGEPVTPPRTTLVTIEVELVDDWLATWAWTVDGPGGANHGYEATEAEAWHAARAAAWDVLGRLEVPGGGDQLRRAINGEGT